MPRDAREAHKSCEWSSSWDVSPSILVTNTGLHLASLPDTPHHVSATSSYSKPPRPHPCSTMPTLSSQGAQAIQSTLDQATSKPKGLVGTVFAAGAWPA